MNRTLIKSFTLPLNIEKEEKDDLGDLFFEISCLGVAGYVVDDVKFLESGKIELTLEMLERRKKPEMQHKIHYQTPQKCQ